MPVTSEVCDRIAEIVIDHPPVNALDSAGWFELAGAVHDAEASDASVILLRAEGRGFCAGVDIKELAADSSRITSVNRGCYDAFAAIHDAKIPVVVAVHGFVLGGGLGLAGSADIVVAADDAYFGLPEIDRGAMGAASHALRMFGVQVARYMLYTGQSIDAAEARRLTGVLDVVPRNELDSHVRELARTIAEKSPKAVRLAKESLDGIEPFDLKLSYRFEQGFTYELYTESDSHEAREAFVEGRDASFGGTTE